MSVSERAGPFTRSVEAVAVPRPRRSSLPDLRGLVLPIALVATWQELSQIGVFNPQTVPSPTEVLRELNDLAGRGELAGHVLATAWRVAFGFAAGTLTATALGALTGYSSATRAYLDPTLQALKAVPSLAWVPLFILWFGIFEASKITLIAVGVFFPVYLNLMTGIRATDRKLVEVGRINGLGRLDMVRRILIPSTLPSYFTGLRSGLALGWMFVIAAELMGANQGLGFLMLDGQMTGRPAVIVGSLILFALAGKLTDAAIVSIGRKLLSWQDDFGGTQDRETR